MATLGTTGTPETMAMLGATGTPEITGAVGIEGTRAVIMVPWETTELQGVPGTMEMAEATAAQVG
jgi:hypothetical protein